MRDSGARWWGRAGARVARCAAVGALACVLLPGASVGGQEPPLPDALRLGTLFGDGMVVQRGEAIPVAGTAAAGVEVEVTFAGRRGRATSDASGSWRVVLPHPLRYPIGCVIWYQGESNANSDEQAAAYRELFADLIRSWREEWGGGEPFPFLWVQLPNYGRVDTVPPAGGGWAILRESQAAALSLPRTGQAVAIDVGDAADLPPPDKQPVGERVALLARRIAYGEDIVASGPTYRSHAARDGRIVITFDHVGGGLTTREPGGDVRGFAIAGPAGRWVWANARIEGDAVVAWSADVSDPVHVRHARGNSPPSATLYNREGLPAAPFRSAAGIQRRDREP